MPPSSILPNAIKAPTKIMPDIAFVTAMSGVCNAGVDTINANRYYTTNRVLDAESLRPPL